MGKCVGSEITLKAVEMSENDMLDAEASGVGKVSGNTILIASGGRGDENRTAGHRRHG